VLVGNAHGKYKKPPKLDIARVAACRKATGVPLVLHGGSGIPDEAIKEGIASGIRKVNFATDLCYTFLDKCNETYNAPEKIIAIDNFMKPSIAALKEYCLVKIKLLGADGKA